MLLPDIKHGDGTTIRQGTSTGGYYYQNGKHTQLRAKVTPPDPEANAHLPPRHWATRSRGHTGQFAPMHAMRVFTPQNHAVGAHRKTVRRRWGRARAAIATWLYIF